MTPDLHVREENSVLTILLALAFSLVVCTVVAFGVTTIVDRVTATAKEQRERFSIKR